MQLFTLSRSNLFSTNERTKKGKSAAIDPKRIDIPRHSFRCESLGTNSRRGTQEVTSTEHRQKHFFLSAGKEAVWEERGIQSIQIGNTMTRRVFAEFRVDGGGGVCWVTEKFTKAAIIGSFCGQSVYRETMGNNTNNRGWKLFSPQFPFVGGQGTVAPSFLLSSVSLEHLLPLLIFGFSFLRERERERSSSAPCLSFLISNKRGIAPWSILHFFPPPQMISRSIN